MSLSQEDVTRLEILVSFIEEGSGGPTPPEDVDRAQVALGRDLPLDLRRWVESVDAAVLAAGHLHVEPVLGRGEADDRVTALATRTSAMRASGWALPDELIVVADDGKDLAFAEWIPTDGTGPNVVVAFRTDGDGSDPSFWIVGESWLTFLVGWTAAHAHLHHGAVYELLQVPGELQRPVEDTVTVDEVGRAVDHESRARGTSLLAFASPAIPGVTWPGEGSIALSADGLRAAIAELPRPADPRDAVTTA